MNRNEKILTKCDLNGIGLEIAPSINPILPKKSGHKIETLDCLDKEGLRKKYESHEMANIEKIEDVDYVWNGEPYLKLLENQTIIII